MHDSESNKQTIIYAHVQTHTHTRMHAHTHKVSLQQGVFWKERWSGHWGVHLDLLFHAKVLIKSQMGLAFPASQSNWSQHTTLCIVQNDIRMSLMKSVSTEHYTSMSRQFIRLQGREIDPKCNLNIFVTF